MDLSCVGHSVVERAVEKGEEALGRAIAWDSTARSAYILNRGPILFRGPETQ